jgi:hypothetical protein
MSAMTDPRAAVEFRLPAIELRPGDLVNTTPGEDDWQEVVGVFVSPGDARSDEIRSLVSLLKGRYVVVQLTDLAPVDGGVYFDGNTAMIYADDDAGDVPVSEVVSGSDGIRTYLYTKFELVSVRAASS